MLLYEGGGEQSVEIQVDFSSAPEWAWGWCCFAAGEAEWFGAMQNQNGMFGRVEGAPCFGQSPGAYALRQEPGHA